MGSTHQPCVAGTSPEAGHRPVNPASAAHKRRGRSAVLCVPRANPLTAPGQPRGVRHRSGAPASSRQLWGQVEADPLGLHRGQARRQRTQPWPRATVRHRCMGVESGPFGSGRRCRDAPGRRRCTKRLRGRRSCRLHLLHKKPSCQTHAAAPPASPAGRQRPGSRCVAPPASAAPLQGPHARSSLPLAQPVHKRPGSPRNAACISPDPAGTARRRVRAVPCRAMTAAGEHAKVRSLQIRARPHRRDPPAWCSTDGDLTASQSAPSTPQVPASLAR